MLSRRSILITLTFMILTAVMATVDAKPERKSTEPAAPKKAETQPDIIVGETNWGKLERNGKNFTITGHDTWEAVGEIRTRKDGSRFLFILWTLLSNGRAAPGIYEIGKDGLTGTWGYAEDVTLEDGKLSGSSSSDRI